MWFVDQIPQEIYMELDGTMLHIDGGYIYHFDYLMIQNLTHQKLECVYRNEVSLLTLCIYYIVVIQVFKTSYLVTFI